VPLPVQLISYIIALPESNVALVQMPRVPNSHGHMTINVRQPDEHYSYIDLSQFIWRAGMWRRRRAADRSAAGFFHFNLKTSGQSDLEKGCITAALGIVHVLYNGLAYVPLTGAPFHGDLDPNLVQGSLSPHKSACQTASQLVQPFLHSLPVCPVHTDLAACDV